ncbi:thymidine kinase, cytosolic-like [Schistocerca gregaria]|uniref:thymidine kinase, cytosolic-like n=1 Tax=Schistocerca gregaria TaxID=7010 RepID=UPI00211F3992|nr:thymidine kinase, cytosolic-like [Schistocerca gregaria]
MEQEYNGRIEIIFGPMFSGKTTELIRRIRRHALANKRCMVVKYEYDQNYPAACISTHDMQKWDAVSYGRTLGDLESIVAQYDVIGIDEGQFISYQNVYHSPFRSFPNIAPFCESLANRGKTVIVAALDGTFQRKCFNSILSLVPISETVVKLSAVCMYCFKDAAFTMRMTSEVDIEVIGRDEKYVSACRACFFKNRQNPTKEIPRGK